MIDIKNYMEICVDDALDGILNAIQCCRCEECKMDIKAIALNTLPSKYVVTKQGELYTKLASLAQQCDVDIIAAITKAAVIVSRNPRHGKDEI